MLVLQVCLGPRDETRPSSAQVGSEALLLGTLRELLAERLREFETTAEEDEALLSSGGLSSPRMEVAVRYRLERKRMLLTAVRTLTVLEEAYRQCPS